MQGCFKPLAHRTQELPPNEGIPSRIKRAADTFPVRETRPGFREELIPSACGRPVPAFGRSWQRHVALGVFLQLGRIILAGK